MKLTEMKLHESEIKALRIDYVILKKEIKAKDKMLEDMAEALRAISDSTISIAEFTDAKTVNNIIYKKEMIAAKALGAYVRMKEKESQDAKTN